MCFQTSRFADVSNETHTSNFDPFKVVGRGSETQLQVDENILSNPDVNAYFSLFKKRTLTISSF